MKRFTLILIVLLSLILAGCTLTDFLTPNPAPDPDLAPTTKANVDAVLTGDSISWSIENIGDENIFKYVITFDVFYPMIEKDNVILEATGYALGIGEKHEDVLYLLPYDTPKTVSVTWELYD